MPLYDFRCTDCGHIAEMLIRTSVEKESPACPRCGSARLERLLSAPNIPKTAAGTTTRCGQASPCCGSATPCEKPPCS